MNKIKIYTINSFNKSENILMFLFLGIFEYYFFMNIIMNIIMKYETVADEELEYKITNGFIGYLNQTEIK
jgi:hypothetical protein